MALPKEFSHHSIRGPVKDSVANLTEGLTSYQSYSEVDFIELVSKFTGD